LCRPSMPKRANACARWKARKQRRPSRGRRGTADTLRANQARRGSGATPGHSSEWVLGGPLIVTFDRGDVRLTPSGLVIYGDEARWEVPVSPDIDGRHGIVNQVYQSIAGDRRPAADGYWGKATLEVMLAVLESGRNRKEVFLSHQTPTFDVAN
jgi:hypothetical protein